MLLDELNSLLAQHGKDLGLPTFRSEVSPSGNNLPWLKKHLPRNPRCPVRIQELVQKPIQELSRP